MNGMELAGRIRAEAQFAQLRIVLLTTMNCQKDLQRLAELQVSACLSKPITERKLVECVNAALAQPLPEDRSCMANADGAGWEERSAAPAAEKSGAVVLLVEDNVVNQKVARRFLERLGCKVTIANDGADGVRKYGSGKFDLILMDLQMPHMSGLVATDKIRHLEAPGERIPIVALTADVMTGQRERCVAAGMDDFLTKPVDVAELRRVLERFVGARDLEPIAEATQSNHQSDKTMNQPSADTTMTNEAALEVLTSVADASVAAPQAAAVDFAKLEELTDGDREFARELTDIYIASCGQVLCAMRECVTRADRDGLRKAAHQLAGASGNIHATELWSLCKALEAEAGRQSESDSSASIEAIAAEVARSTAALQEYIAAARSAA
jgi:hypothetical protein